jgi:DNA topoisomerase-1
MRQLPGPRLFQYRTAHGRICRVTAREVNAFLREIAGASISLKDFRTMSASAGALAALARTAPAARQSTRRKQVLSALRVVADDLGNTPAVCRKSYVHPTVLSAFEDGALTRLSRALNGSSTTRRARALARVVSKAAP